MSWVYMCNGGPSALYVSQQLSVLVSELSCLSVGVMGEQWEQVIHPWQSFHFNCCDTSSEGAWWSGPVFEIIFYIFGRRVSFKHGSWVLYIWLLVPTLSTMQRGPWFDTTQSFPSRKQEYDCKECTCRGQQNVPLTGQLSGGGRGGDSKNNRCEV